MNTQNTFHSPDEDPALVEIDRLHNNETGEERDEPKAVQSEVERDVEEFVTVFGNHLSIDHEPFNQTYLTLHVLPLIKHWLREKLTTYQHRIEEAKKEERERIRHKVQELTTNTVVWSLIEEALTPKEPNDTV